MEYWNEWELSEDNIFSDFMKSEESGKIEELFKKSDYVDFMRFLKENGYLSL